MYLGQDKKLIETVSDQMKNKQEICWKLTSSETAEDVLSILLTLVVKIADPGE